MTQTTSEPVNHIEYDYLNNNKRSNDNSNTNNSKNNYLNDDSIFDCLARLGRRGGEPAANTLQHNA